MKKIYIFIAIGLIILGGILGFYFYKKNPSNTSNNSNLNNFPYNSTRISSTENNVAPPSNELQQHDSNVSNQTENIVSENNSQPSETEIASFTTKIYTKDSNRQTNISITCSSLNNTTVENGETFSFCNTIGKATSQKGYKKADVFQDGEKIEALGRTESARLVLLCIMLYSKLII